MTPAAPSIVIIDSVTACILDVSRAYAGGGERRPFPRSSG
jgi:hypothetical protein